MKTKIIEVLPFKETSNSAWALARELEGKESEVQLILDDLEGSGLVISRMCHWGKSYTLATPLQIAKYRMGNEYSTTE